MDFIHCIISIPKIRVVYTMASIEKQSLYHKTYIMYAVERRGSYCLYISALQPSMLPAPVILYGAFEASNSPVIGYEVFFSVSQQLELAYFVAYPTDNRTYVGWKSYQLKFQSTYVSVQDFRRAANDTL